jgi:tRNA(fMet)-specific endonuclease VapC
MQYLLDTNICIYIIKKKPTAVLEKFNKIALGEIAISSITLSELEYGINKSSDPLKNRVALNQFIIPLEILNFDRAASIEYGIIRAKLEVQGKTIGPLDTLIAAHAKSMNLVLVTNNVNEFNRVEGLKIENWVLN